MPAGGYRPGAGRKKGSKASHTLVAAQMRERLIERVRDHIDPLINAYLDTALGIWVEQKVNGTAVKVYRKPPDLFALKNLLDQAIGRAKESLEHSGSVTLEDLYKKASDVEKENELGPKRGNSKTVQD